MKIERIYSNYAYLIECWIGLLTNLGIYFNMINTFNINMLCFLICLAVNHNILIKYRIQSKAKTYNFYNSVFYIFKISINCHIKCLNLGSLLSKILKPHWTVCRMIVGWHLNYIYGHTNHTRQVDNRQGYTLLF